ncbi:cellulose synthase-like protein H1 isoform X2 [Ziziphus jujuba]|uniref:Cellulose synthase-like protein H1 isoform X2 n=2 Tax=Ziziphus jujuba TaxID=326968 RepID=A0AC41YW67_ZIZJJ|nr:cellulose synthase-like protein H1 isoform X2 [Ziziphus jujuba]
MANNSDSPLCEIKYLNNNKHRSLSLIVLLLKLYIVAYRLVHLSDHGFPWFIAFLCDCWYTFIWLLWINIGWTSVDYKTHPQLLLQRFPDLPRIDLFVTTTDPMLEPPITTVNTVLSLMAVDYPADKLACYVSDDGCFPITLYSLTEAAKFASFWIPFCKKYNLQVRAPLLYFSSKSTSKSDSPSEIFHEEERKMKEEYEKLREKIEDAVHGKVPIDLSGDYAVFADTQKNNHPAIIKIIVENKERLSNGLPHLIYVCREKRPNYQHHYKAGAVNVLTRVSGAMTNAPFTLNVDSDMFVNNPKIIKQAMCLLLGLRHENCAYIQCRDIFYNDLKDDPFGNNFLIAFEILGRGMSGIQGPMFGGSGFHRREVIYGLTFDEHSHPKGKMSYEEMKRKFGNSMELNKLAAQTLSGESDIDGPLNLSSRIETACQVANCDYEHETEWGSKIGWVYGSITEDIVTGMKIHSRGWRSVLYISDPPSFIGSAPLGGPTVTIQRKRWATGQLEVLFSKNNPLFLTLKGKLKLRQCLAYMWILLWGASSIPELFYTFLPIYSIITNSYFLPKVGEVAFIGVIALVLTQNLQHITFCMGCGQNFRECWNGMRMNRITNMTSSLLACLSWILKFFGISETFFEVTKKYQPIVNDGADSGRFSFDDSAMYVPITTLLFLHLTALFMPLLGLRPLNDVGRCGPGLLEYIFSLFMVISYWPYVRGLFGKGEHGIPFSTKCKSSILVLIFLLVCKLFGGGSLFH